MALYSQFKTQVNTWLHTYLLTNRTNKQTVTSNFFCRKNKQTIDKQLNIRQPLMSKLDTKLERESSDGGINWVNA